ncbi:MAG TPA: Flp family type IVb pilin [Acidimicrobiales bacterium]|nr:Flp family type IVb pilin [Acidimicrobiales bacterium]
MPNTHLQRRLRRDERGASLVEYALLLALIAVVCVVAVSLLGGNLNKSYSKDASSVAATPG